MVVVDFPADFLYFNIFIVQAQTDCVVVTQMIINNHVIVVNKIVIVCENKIKNVVLSCWLANMLLKKEFTGKIEKILSLPSF